MFLQLCRDFIRILLTFVNVHSRNQRGLSNVEDAAGLRFKNSLKKSEEHPYENREFFKVRIDRFRCIFDTGNVLISTLVSARAMTRLSRLPTPEAIEKDLPGVFRLYLVYLEGEKRFESANAIHLSRHQPPGSS